jgi:hypothetical protein
MTNKERMDLIKKIFNEECVATLETKGHDYTQGSDDANKNFKTLAKRLFRRGFDAFDIWAVFFFKHIDAIETWLQDRVVKSEPIEARIMDAINYLFILRTLMVDDGTASEATIIDIVTTRLSKDEIRELAQELERLTDGVSGG